MLYSCTHMATEGVKGLIYRDDALKIPRYVHSYMKQTIVLVLLQVDLGVK